jgi:hypothetical protein
MLMLSRDFTVRLSTAQTVHEAEQRKSQLAHKKVQMALLRRVKNLTEELRVDTNDWSL